MNYLFAAYLVIWVLIFGYTQVLGRREKQSREELALLKRSLEKNGVKLNTQGGKQFV